MKQAIQIENAILINNHNIVNKLCLNGVPIADYNIAEIKRLFINNQWIDILDFQTSVAIWGGVNVHYLIDCNQEIQDFYNVTAFIDDEYFYQPLFDKATTDNLTYFQKRK